MNQAKYKIGFTGSAQMLFALMSKLLPDDLQIEVEEVEIGQAKLAQSQTKLAKPKPKRTVPRYSDGPNLKKGINGIILTHMSDGMGHNTFEFRKPLKAAGYSESSVSSRLDELRRYGIIEKIDQGVWRTTDKYRESSNAA